MKSILTAIVVIILFSSGYSQTKQFFDSPFGGGGGYTPSWVFPNFDEINKKISNIDIPAFSSSGFYSSGGAGFIYPGFIPNLRVGGMGFGGSTSESVLKSGFTYEAEYSIGGGGLTIEYTLPLIKDFGVSLGAIIGAGSLEIELNKNPGSFNWNEIWSDLLDEPLPPSLDSKHYELQNDYWFFSPTINIEFPVYRFIAIRIGGGYQLTFGDEWTANNDKELLNVPDKLNGNGFFIQSGIFLGFFAY
jgi:hypothetical protein